MNAVRQCLKVLGALLLLCLPVTARAQQPATLNGKIKGTEGSVVSGATIIIPSLGLSTTSHADGQYTLLIPANRYTAGQSVAVTVRAINYKARTVQVVLTEGIVTTDFTLDVNPLQLGEVVVTGAGTLSEVEKIGNVRNNVDSSQIRRSAEPNLINALAAKAPNVYVQSSAGDPGASSSIVIRGINTLSSTSQPLFVVDGMPIENQTISTSTFDGTGFGDQQGTYAPNRGIDINPDDIESVEILKGAAAGAIYGARAGQGVVMITTKKGRPGGTTYSLNSTLSVNDVTRFPSLQQSFGQGNGGVADVCGGPDCELTTRSWGPAITAGTPTYDHTKEAFATGTTWDNNLTIAGGNDRTSFYFSGAYLNQQGTYVGPNNNFIREGFRLKGQQRLGNKWVLGANAYYASSNGDFVQKGSNFSGILLGSWRATPIFDNTVYLDPTNGLHRSFAFPQPSANSFDLPRGYDNPFFVANEDISQSLTNRVIGNATLDFYPTSWLHFTGILGADYSGDSRLQGQAQTSSNTPLATGQVIKLDITANQVDANVLGVATWKASSKLNGDFTLGTDLNSRSLDIVGATGNGLLGPQPFSLGNTGSQNPPIDSLAKIRTNGVYSQVTAGYDDQLFLKAGVRYDGSSTFGANNQYNWYPSASAAWQFTHVTGTFNGVISYGKLRAAYGQVGTQPAPYLGSIIYKAGGSFADPFGPFQTPPGGLFTPTTQPATDLKPERTEELEAGVDLGLFKDMTDVSFTWYNRLTTDVILQVPVAASSGYQSQWANGAEIRNRGTELTVNVRPISKANMQWSVGFLFGTNRNEVLSLNGASEVSFGGLGGFGVSVAQVGLPLGVFEDYDYVRCGRGIQLNDGAGGVYDVDANCSSSQQSDHALFIADGNLAANNGGYGDGYPLIDPTKRIVADPNPDWLGSFTTSFRYKAWTITGLLDIKHGGDVYNGTRGALMEIGTSQESADLRGSTAVVGGPNFIPQSTAGPGAGIAVPLTEDFLRGYYTTFTTMGQPFYENGGYVKLREIAVSYTWASRFITQTLNLSSVNLRVGGRNLITWTSYTGVDPETSLGGADSPAQGVDWFSSPQARSFVFAVTLNK